MTLDTVLIEDMIIMQTQTKPHPPRQISARGCNSLSYRFSGCNIIKYDGGEMISKAGSLTFMPDGTGYSHEVVEESRQIAVNFSAKNSLGGARCFTLPARCGIEEAFLEMYRLWEMQPVNNSILAMAAFYGILATIQKNARPTPTKEEKLLESSLAYMHKNFRDQEFSLNKLYGLAFVSPAYYRRIFNKCYGCPPVEYLKNLRISFAKQLLQSGFHTVAEVAELSGYSSYTHFSSEFKKAVGIPPSKFKN